jgi:DNA (cytosine-5)-methyltransferase 1
MKSRLLIKKEEMKILNLYAGIGGNRKLWTGHQITAVEWDSDIAKIYKDFFSKDDVIVTDAHQYLLDHYSKFDFIWSSPPCQSHSSFRQNICVRYRGTKPVYPDMSLYQEILFLQSNFKGKWIVENVKPYYEPLIKPNNILQRHLFWSNFEIKDKEFAKDHIRTAQIPDLQIKYGFDLSNYKLKNKRQILRNCILPELGLHILNQVKDL